MNAPFLPVGFIGFDPLLPLYAFCFLIFLGVAVGARGVAGSIGSPLVLKSWRANNKPMQDGSYVHIVGRRSGFMAWVLSILGIDPITEIKVTQDRIELLRNSIAGSERRVIPLCSVSSSFYGFHKPWIKALLLGLFVAGLTMALFVTLMAALVMRNGAPPPFQDSSPILHLFAVAASIVAGFLVGLWYFSYYRTQTIGFVEVGGASNGIQFMPSIIEGVTVNDAQSKYVAELIQYLIQTRLDR